MLVALFLGEALVASLLLDGDAPVARAAWLAVLVHSWGGWVARLAIASCAIFVTFSFLRYQPALRSLAARAGEPFRWGWLGLHFASIAIFSLASLGVFPAVPMPARESDMAAVAWIFAAIAAIASAGLAFLPWKFWLGMVRVTGRLWLYAVAAAALTGASTNLFRSMWDGASHITFRLVQLLLSLFVSDLVIQPDRRLIGTHRFTAIISEQCSGLEGIGLLLVFGCVWLILFRHEARFPQALILFPLGVVTLFLLNAIRITGLILIGNTGARDIAAGGFHSQAGWIAFNSVAFGSSIAARRWRWISARECLPPAAETSTATTVFLAPFLAILAAGMISRASSGAFEWLYPIRVLAALAALWVFRHSFRHLDWGVSRVAVAVGFAVFILWVTVDHLLTGTSSMPMALAGTAAPLRYGWIGLRLVGAVVTVPIAEELAFRGFVLRRLVNADFESVGFQTTTWAAVLGSSVLFGLMHGGHWMLATLAGTMYAFLIRRTGRFGDAVIAHALTNGLIAGYVLMFDQWQLW